MLIRDARRRGERRAARALGAARRTTLLDAFGGHRWRMAAIQGRIAMAKARYALGRWNDARRADAVAEFWRAATELGRLRASAGFTQPPRGINLGDVNEVRMAETSPSVLIGFHAAESWQDIDFRWSNSVAVLPVALAGGDYELSIDTASLRGAPCDFPWLLMWNESLIPATSCHVADGRIHARITADMFVPDEPQHLLIASAPPPRNRRGPIDPRRLGMPIRAIRFTPA